MDKSQIVKHQKLQKCVQSKEIQPSLTVNLRFLFTKPTFKRVL